jgi:hypothetical protein
MYVSNAADSKASDFQQFYYDAYRTWSTFYAEAYRDVRAYAGDNWTNQEKTYLQSQRRTVLELNRIRRIINLYSGFERENRKSIVVGPMESSDEDTAEQLSEVMQYVYDKSNAYQINSEAFDHMLKSGLAVIGIYIDYNRDKVNGDIKYYWKPFNAVIFDPYFTKRDLSDCDQAATRDLLSKDQVKMMLPWISPKEIDDLPTGIRDNKYQYLGVYRQYNSTYIAKHLVTYDQYWKVIQRPVKLLVDLETGESTEWTGKGDDEAALQEILADEPNVKVIETKKRSVELSIIVAGTTLYTGPDPTGLDDFPFRPVIGYFEPLIDTYEYKIQGVVRSMKDAQRLYNKKWSSLTDYNESVLNTGWIVRNGAVVDPDMLYQTGQGRVVVLNREFTMQDIQPIRPAELPQTALAYSDRIEKDLVEIPGASDELMGISSTGDSQVSGRLAQIRSSNGLKGNRGLFDNYEETLRQVGMLTLACIQKNYSAGKIKRIIRRDPTPQILNQNFEQYDCVIKQAVLTQTQREAYYYDLLRLRELGIAIPDDEIIDAAPLQGKSRLKDRIKQQQEQQAEQQRMQMEDKARMDRLTEAKTEESIALAQERRARVLADIGLARERIAEGDQNQSKAFLDNVKAAKELDQMDIDSARQAFELQQSIKMASKLEAEAMLQSDIAKEQELRKPPQGEANGQ